MGIQDKAIKMLAEGRVIPEHVSRDNGPSLFTVIGDSDRYRTVVGPTVRMCRCRFWRERLEDCSHITAVYEWMTATPQAKELMEQARAARAAKDAAEGEAAFDELGL